MEESQIKIDLMDESIKENNRRLENLNNRMGTINAHLENIERESAKTTLVLEQEQIARKEHEVYERELNLQKFNHDKEIVDDNRRALKLVVQEIWEIFKKPLGFLITAIAGYLTYKYLSTGV